MKTTFPERYLSPNPGGRFVFYPGWCGTTVKPLDSGNTYLRLSVTFYFLGHTNQHKELLKVMSASKGVVLKGVCTWCSTPYKYNCPWCPHHLKNLKIQGDVVQDLKQKLRDLQTEHQELEIEYFCLKREHQRLRQTLVELRALYHNQIDMIEILKEKAIENIGKRLISFLFKQSWSHTWIITYFCT